MGRIFNCGRRRD